MIGMQMVFDFDCTITTKLYFLFITLPDVFCNRYNYDRSKLNVLKQNMLVMNYTTFDEFINLLFGCRERLKKIEELFIKIKKEKLYILSYGFKWQIVPCLKYIGLLKYFNNENIYGFENISKKYIWLQNHLNENLVYIDDTSNDHIVLIEKLKIKKYDCSDHIIYKKYFIGSIKYYYVELKKESTGMDCLLIDLLLKIFTR